MFNFLNRNKIDMSTVTDILDKKHFAYEKICDTVLSVKGHYRNHGHDFKTLYLYFSPKGDKVSFKDTIGRLVTKIPEVVAKDKAYSQILNIFGYVMH